MAKRMSARRSRSRSKTKQDDLPLVVVIAIGGGLFLGYFIGETVLLIQSHPVHWGVAALGGVVGWALGKVYYKFRGDII
ncbi:MAG: hypothetical protein ACC700_16965 [Anaerolineales bacterium]